MGDWRVCMDKIRILLDSENIPEAKKEVEKGLEKTPNQINLLIIASDVNRASGHRDKSLEYAELMITYHPDKPPGYIRAAQDLMTLKRYNEAQEMIQIGLNRIPNQVNLLIIANNVYRVSDDREKSLKYANLLITYHPDNWNGYGRGAQDLAELKRFKEAKKKVSTGLKKLPNQLGLLTIASEIYRASGDHEKSLEYAELIITNYPRHHIGFERLAHYLHTDEQFQEAKSIIDEGLKQNNYDPHHLKSYALCMWHLGHTTKALYLANKLLCLNPSELSANSIVIDILISCGKDNDANSILKRLLNSETPLDFNFLKNISNSLRLSGNHLAAVEISRIMVSLYPCNPKSYARLTQDLFLSGNTEEAQSLIRCNYKNQAHDQFLVTAYHILCASQNLKLAEKIFSEILARNVFNLSAELMDSNEEILNNLLPSNEHIINTNYVNISGSLQKHGSKIELIVVAGCSGCGKSTVLNTLRDKLRHIDANKSYTFGSELQQEAALSLSKYDSRLNILCQGRYHRALTFGGYFEHQDLDSLNKEEKIPSRIFMHVDLRYLLLCNKRSSFDFRRSIDLIEKDENDKVMRETLSHPFFFKCQSIKVFTMAISHDENKNRFYSRQKEKKFFRLRNITSKSVHSELYSCWFRNLHIINPTADNLITEHSGIYTITTRD